MVTRGRGTINQPGQSRSTSQAASGSGIQTLPVAAVFHGSCKLLQKARSEQASSFHDKLHVDMVSDARLRHPIIFQSSNPGPIQLSSQASSELSSSQAIQVPSSLPVLAAHSAKGESHLAECAGSSPQQSQADPRSPRRTGTVLGLGCSFP